MLPYRRCSFNITLSCGEWRAAVRAIEFLVALPRLWYSLNSEVSVVVVRWTQTDAFHTDPYDDTIRCSERGRSDH